MAEYFDDDDDDVDNAIASAMPVEKTKPKRGFNQFAGKPEAPMADFDKVIAEALASNGGFKEQRYDTPINPNVRLPKLRPGGTVAPVEEAFSWAYPGLGTDKKGKPKKPDAKKDNNILGLKKGQMKKAVALPGLAPIFDFMNIYAADVKKGRK